MLTVIRGHVSPETAFVVDDYPYGSLRCKIRYWLEKATKGVKKGQYRYMSQTTNPKKDNEVFSNAAKGSVYADFMVMVVDQRGYVFYRSLHGMSGGPESFASWVAEGVRHQLNEEEAKEVAMLEKYSRHFSPNVWAEWDGAVVKVREMLDELHAELKTGSPDHLHRLYEERHGFFYRPRFDAILNYIDGLDGKYLDALSTPRGT